METIYDPIKNVEFLDSNFNTSSLARADSASDKVDLSIGSICDESGKFYMFKSVLKAEQLVLSNKERNENYLFIDGDGEFCTAAKTILFPESSPEELREILSLQTLGGSGAISLFLQLFSKLNYSPTVYLSDPTWTNYISMIKNAGLQHRYHPYLVKDEFRLDIQGLINFLSDANFYDILILQVCSHNPSGFDLSKSDWDKVLEVVQRKRLIVLMDIPYQGLAKDFKTDVYPCSLFLKASPPVELFIAQSFSKIMGLCSGRIGCLHFKTNHYPNNLKNVFLNLIRSTYSNPPRHYASIVKTVLTNEQLKSEWLSELNMLSSVLKAMRASLCDKMVREFGEKWRFISEQSGLYVYLNIEDEDNSKLRDKHVYMSSGGRIVLSRLNASNIDIFVTKLKSIF